MSPAAATADRTRLSAWLPTAIVSADEALERFLGWVDATGLTLYPAQEEAVLEIMAGRHVVLSTPTGSGKSLVALAMHFLAICRGQRSTYTSPIKALVNEKFFDLCAQLGPAHVGMATGDASVNPGAAVLCCTAEILANRALREGEQTDVDAVVMDEFHFYSDPDRGIAWQLPLLTLPQVRFLLMSATLGDVRQFQEGIARLAGGEVVLVKSEERPVPLDWEWRETPVHETIQDLVDRDRAPIYVVSFTQRDAAEQAQALTSLNLCSKEGKRAVLDAIGDFRFDTTYGRDVRRLLSHGVGLHHAGLLPKYRALVERLTQQGLLPIVCGTDTLGVGINVPIRTVLFTKLCKFDGEKVRILTVRDFKQIAGRAGRKGFDVRGTVVAQAPEHIIENQRLEAKSKMSGGKKKFVRRKPPERGFVPWDAQTFTRLQTSEPEPLESRFTVTHGMLLSVLDREFNIEEPDGGYARLVRIIARSYERPAAQSRHRRHAAVLFRSLRAAGIVDVGRPPGWRRACVRTSPGLQRDFSLHHTLSMYLLDVLEHLDPESESFALDVVSVVEAILETPDVVVRRQLDKLKDELFARMREEGAEYEERMARLEALEHPKPRAELIYATFDEFRVHHPWVRSDNVRPKSIARDMVERYASFNEYVAEYGIARSEGVLLRYLSQAYKTLLQNVPVAYHDERVLEVVAFLRAVLARVDSSLVSEWERMMSETMTPEVEDAPRPVVAYDLARDPKALAARVRAELHALVRALGRGDLEEALGGLRHDPEDPWTIPRLEDALAPCLADIGRIDVSPASRWPSLTRLAPKEERVFAAEQILVGADGERTPWTVEAEVDLRQPEAADGPLLVLRRIDQLSP